jgi:GDP/UDP-N,N'-diacetylbacillosamine 2-epimerase (hydrolysing)
MGILEGPYYQLPVVNIGRRQMGRLNAGNVIFVDYDTSKILEVLEKSCFNKDYIKKVKGLENPFGDGRASIKIAKSLESIDLNEQKWYIKKRLV